MYAYKVNFTVFTQSDIAADTALSFNCWLFKSDYLLIVTFIILFEGNTTEKGDSMCVKSSQF